MFLKWLNCHGMTRVSARTQRQSNRGDRLDCKTVNKPIMLAVLLVFSCGGPGQPAGTDPASPAQVQHISKSLKPGLTLANAYVVRSVGHRNAYFFAAKIVGSSRDRVGVWLVFGPPDFAHGRTVSVDPDAKACSVGLDASKSDAAVTIRDPPASELERFVESVSR